MRKLLLALLIVGSSVALGADSKCPPTYASPFALADSGNCPPNYGYSGYLVPEQWQFVTNQGWYCGTEKKQSPIAVVPPFEPESQNPIKVAYKASLVTVMNSGHDIRVIPALGNNTISTREVPSASLDEFHFHVPNEHTIPGYAEKLAGEMHFVHTDPTNGNLYVIAQLLEESPDDNRDLSPFLNPLPINLCGCQETKADLAPLLPEQIPGYYRYVGSLTTPDCRGGVTFFVLPTTMKIGKNQLAALRHFGENARPRQDLDGRPITRVTPE